MSDTSVLTWVLAALQGSIVGALFLLAVFIGVSVVVGLGKLRHRGRAGARSLDELVGDAQYARYLPPDTPRGPIDQLRGGTSGGPLA